MRYHRFIFGTIALLLLQFSCTLGSPSQPGGSNQSIDVMDYFRQSDDTGQRWTLGGKDVRPDTDPDGTTTPTLVLNKWSSPNTYEVYKVLPNELQLRYEVMRHDPADTAGTAKDWIRRYQEIGPNHGQFPGSVWMPRHVVPGDGTVFESRATKDRYVFDPKSHSYKLDESGSGAEDIIKYRLVWADNDWTKQNNPAGLQLNPALRLISEWQREGKIFEMYDYSKGKGPVAWRWLERVNTLPPAVNDSSGRVFRCENGQVYLQSAGDAAHPPVVFKYDKTTGARGGQLEVISFTNDWKPELGPQWYVVFRDSTREEVLDQKFERVPHDFSLPEWTALPGATIADLPGHFTSNRKR
jgi:hypothetical protein